MSTPSPCWWTATATVEALRRREISPLELAEIYLARCREVASLRAFVAICADEFLAGAATAQIDMEKGRRAGRLAALPFTVKDLIATAGTRTAAGSRLLEYNVPSVDAPAVARLRREGGLLLGKTACPEFGFGVTTESTVHGRTLNPWDPQRSPGGSSGGESALIAAGGSPLGLGTDYGGSVRWPAHSTGIFALRPTPGRVPAGGQVPGAGGGTGCGSRVVADTLSMQGTLQVIGPMARCVADLELALSLISGYEEDDALCISPPYSGPFGVVDREMPVGWWADDGTTQVSDDVANMVETVVQQMERDGFRMVHRPKAVAGGHERYNDLRRYDPLLSCRELVKDRPGDIGTELRRTLAARGGPHSYSEAITRERAIKWRGEFLRGLGEFPVLLGPVAPSSALRHEGFVSVGSESVGAWQLMAFCRAVSLAGVPAVAVPCGVGGDGMPLALQVVGPPFREDLVLGVAKYLEDAFGGFRVPPRYAGTSGSRTKEPGSYSSFSRGATQSEEFERPRW